MYVPCVLSPRYCLLLTVTLPFTSSHLISLFSSTPPTVPLPFHSLDISCPLLTRFHPSLPSRQMCLRHSFPPRVSALLLPTKCLTSIPSHYISPHFILSTRSFPTPSLSLSFPQFSRIMSRNLLPLQSISMGRNNFESCEYYQSNNFFPAPKYSKTGIWMCKI